MGLQTRRMYPTVPFVYQLLTPLQLALKAPRDKSHAIVGDGIPMVLVP